MLIKFPLVTEANHLPKIKQIMFQMIQLIQDLTKLKLVKVIKAFLNLTLTQNLKL